MAMRIRFVRRFVLAVSLVIGSMTSGIVGVGVTAAQAQEAARPPQKWALLIGIDEYADRNHISRLGGAAADARALRKALVESLRFPDDEHIELLVSDGTIKPTRTEILNSIARLVRNARPGDTVFVLYSGHGIEIDGKSYLLPFDTSALDDSTIVDTALEADKFRERLRKVKASVTLFCFDMCRSDPRISAKDVVAKDNRLTDSLTKGLDFKPVNTATGAASTVATLMSCSEGQRSYEWQEKGRGYFSYFLEQGLRGAAADKQGQVTLGRLVNYVKQKVSATVQTSLGRPQMPLPTITGTADVTLAGVAIEDENRFGRLVSVEARLLVVPSVEGATIKVDGKEVTDGTYTVDLPDDATTTVRVSVSKAGYRPNVREGVILTRGEVLRLPITLTALIPEPRPAPPPVFNPTSAKEIITLEEHTDSVLSASFSPDGKRIITASLDDTAKIWDEDTGQAILTLNGHTNWVQSALFSPDGKRIITASLDDTAKIWDASTGKVILTLKGHANWVPSASFSPDGKYIVTGSNDKTAKVWDANTGQAILALKGHSNYIWSVSFSPNGKRIITASWDKTAKVWDASTGKLITTLTGHSNYVYSAAFSPDGKRIITASRDKTAKVWDASTGKLITTLTGHSSYIWSASFSPDGKRIITASSDKTSKIWNANTGTVILTLKGHSNEILSAAFSPDGKRIVTGSTDKTAKVWQLQ